MIWRRLNRSPFFCFILMVFHFQAKETASLQSSTLYLILTVGYNACWKLICAEWPAVLTSLWENKMVWLQLPTHKTRKKKKERLGIQSMPEMVFFPSHWFMRTGIFLLGWNLAAPSSFYWGVSWTAHLGDRDKPGVLSAPVKVQSLYSCRGGGKRVKEMQTHFKCKYQGNSLH